MKVFVFHSPIKENQEFMKGEVDFLAILKKRDKTLDLESSLFEHFFTSDMRAKIIDWIFGVSQSVKASVKTFHLSVKVLDTFLCRSCKLSPVELYKVSVACFVLAFKFEESKSLSLDVVSQQMTKGFMDCFEIQRLEWKVLDVIGFELFVPTLFDFIEELRIFHDGQARCARFLRDVCLFDVQIMSKGAAKVAEGIFWICCKGKPPTQGPVALCIQEIKRLVENLNLEVFENCFGRYESEWNEKIWTKCI
jgi:hypothetical protein